MRSMSNKNRLMSLDEPGVFHTMSMTLSLRAAVIWLVIACLAVGNGFIRDLVMAPRFGAGLALPLSGISLSVIVFAVTYIAFGFLRAPEKPACLLIGVQWVLMTLAFEWIFGSLVAGKPWMDLLQLFDVTRGNLFSLVLLVTLSSPYLVARIKGDST